jgi:hypothetical protein
MHRIAGCASRLLATYLALWAVTWFFGGRAARQMAIRQITCGAPVPEVRSLQEVKQGPAIAVHFWSPAPFLVSVSYDYAGFIMCGEGAEIKYLWFPFLTRQLNKEVRWLS